MVSTRPTIVTVAVLVVGGISVGHLAKRLPPPIVDIRLTSEVPHNVAERKGSSDNEVVMVYVGSPNCTYCNRPEMAPLVRAAADSLRQRVSTASGDAILVCVGVSVNWVPGEGWRFLDNILNFDEVVIGRNWLNSSVVELGWSYPDAEMATPQIIVYRQKLVLPSDGVRASVTREAPTVRVTGLEDIRRWVEAGSPLQWSG